MPELTADFKSRVESEDGLYDMVIVDFYLTRLDRETNQMVRWNDYLLDCEVKVPKGATDNSIEAAVQRAMVKVLEEDEDAHKPPPSDTRKPVPLLVSLQGLRLAQVSLGPTGVQLTAELKGKVESEDGLYEIVMADFFLMHPESPLGPEDDLVPEIWVTYAKDYEIRVPARSNVDFIKATVQQAMVDIVVAVDTGRNPPPLSSDLRKPVPLSVSLQGLQLFQGP